VEIKLLKFRMPACETGAFVSRFSQFENYRHVSFKTRL